MINNKFAIGISANGGDYNLLISKILPYNFEYHIFGNDIKQIHKCISFLYKYRKEIHLHTDISYIRKFYRFYNKNNVIVRINEKDISYNDSIEYIPKLHRCIVEITEFNNNTIKNVEEICYYYEKYNNFFCGVFININTTDKKACNNFLMTTLKNSFVKQIFKENLYYKNIYYSFINNCRLENKFIIPYNELYINTLEHKIIFEENKYDINTLKNVQSLYKIPNKCSKCIVTNFCPKYKINCSKYKTFYTTLLNNSICTDGTFII